MSGDGSMSSIIRAENLRLSMCGRDIFNVEEFSLKTGGIIALVGPNGAGKTSFLLSMALLREFTSGALYFDGRRVLRRDALAVRRRMAVVFQEPLLLDATVLGNITCGLAIRGVPADERRRRAFAWMERFGIAHLASRHASQLSGGEAQRVNLARAFAMRPDVMFLDEPFAALDYPTRQELLPRLRGFLAETGTAAVFVTHDLSEVPQVASEVAVMFGGRIVKRGRVHDVLDGALLERRVWAPWENGGACR